MPDDRAAGPAPVRELAPRELQERLVSGESLTLLDVREPRERAFCAIPVPSAAINLHIPMREIPSHVDELQEAVSRGPLVLYCHHGVRSRSVAEWLAGRGLSGLFNLQGGIDAWSVEVDPRVPRYY
jgi:rhodanese-related sulfurtransferase